MALRGRRQLLPGALAHVAAIFAREPETGVVAGACERVFADRYRNVVPAPRDAWEIIGARNVLDQPSVFWRGEAHRRAGELDTAFHLAFDWEFWCRLRASGAKLEVTRRALARYHFSNGNKTSLGGAGHVAEGFEIVRRYGPRRGLAHAYRFLYRHFDQHGCLDHPPASSPARLRAYRLAKFAGRCVFGAKWIGLYNWHFASLQQRGLDWWEIGHPTAGGVRGRSDRSYRPISRRLHRRDADAEGDQAMPGGLGQANPGVESAAARRVYRNSSEKTPMPGISCCSTGWPCRPGRRDQAASLACEVACGCRRPFRPGGNTCGPQKASRAARVGCGCSDWWCLALGVPAALAGNEVLGARPRLGGRSTQPTGRRRRWACSRFRAEAGDGHRLAAESFDSPCRARSSSTWRRLTRRGRCRAWPGR